MPKKQKKMSSKPGMTSVQADDDKEDNNKRYKKKSPIVMMQSSKPMNDDGEECRGSTNKQFKTRRRNRARKNYADVDSDVEEEAAKEAADNTGGDDKQLFTVEALRKHRNSRKGKYPKTRPNGERCYEYYVKWDGWSEDNNTWEHEDVLANCMETIQAYWKQINDPKKQKKKPRGNPRKSKMAKQAEIHEPEQLQQSSSPADEEEQEDEQQSDQTYQVEAIRKHRKSMQKKFAKFCDDGTRCMEYYVKWLGWNEDSNTWEHQSTLTKCKEAIDAYWNEVDRKKTTKSKRKKKRKSSRQRNHDEEAQAERTQKPPFPAADDMETKEEEEEVFSDRLKALQEIQEKQPPAKRRKIKLTRKIVEAEGLDLFLDILHGNKGKENQDMLIELVDKVHSLE